MKTSSAMFQRTLLLVAFATFTKSTTPLGSKIEPCGTITEILQTVFKTPDPYKFHGFPDFTYTHDDTSLRFNFINVTLKDFSHVACEYFNTFGTQMAQLTLNGSNVGFNASYSEVDGILQGDDHSSRSPSFLQIYNYAIALRFHYDSYTLDPFKLCITNGSLEITPRAFLAVANFPLDRKLNHELNINTQELVEAAKGYVPRIASNLTKILNDVFCKTGSSSFGGTGGSSSFVGVDGPSSFGGLIGLPSFGGTGGSSSFGGTGGSSSFGGTGGSSSFGGVDGRLPFTVSNVRSPQ